MTPRKIIALIVAVLIAGGLGALAAHRFAPDYGGVSVLFACIAAIAGYAIWLLRTWRTCRGDGTCGTCPRQHTLTQDFYKYCGDHPRIRATLAVWWIILMICCTGLGFLFAHIIGALIGLVLTEAWDHGCKLFR